MLPAMDFDELNDAMAESNRRARRGRTIARQMFASTVALVMVAFALFAAAPTGMGSFGPSPIEGVLTMPIGQLGLVGLAAGLFWMWRIVRPDPDPDAWSWRHLQSSLPVSMRRLQVASASIGRCRRTPSPSATT